MNTPELLIFDMDGLMTDTERLAAKCLKEVGHTYGYTFPKTLFDKINGMDNRRIGSVFRTEYGEDFPYEQIYAGKRKLAAAYIEEHGVPAKPGLHDCLAYAKSRHIRCAVASSTPLTRVRQYLEQLAVLPYFELIQSGEEIERGKPFPDIFLTVCNKLGTEPAKAIVLEDSANGLRAAAAAAIPSIWIPDMVDIPAEVKKTVWKELQSLLEVPAALEELR